MRVVSEEGAVMAKQKRDPGKGPERKKPRRSGNGEVPNFHSVEAPLEQNASGGS
jgi:hypothetical protein